MPNQSVYNVRRYNFLLLPVIHDSPKANLQQAFKNSIDSLRGRVIKTLIKLVCERFLLTREMMDLS